MKVKELRKKSSVRVDIRYFQQLGIQSYGDDNLYPQTVRNIIAASSTEVNVLTVSRISLKVTDSVRFLFRVCGKPKGRYG